VVHPHGQLRRRLRRGRVARHERVLPRRRPRVPHLLHQQPRRRADGEHWNYLDITPLGRQEVWEDSPEGYPQTPTYKWWNWHDSYVADAAPDEKWVEVSDAGEAAFRNQHASTKP
jgi:Bacterial protein of unknown function (DUF899)